MYQRFENNIKTAEKRFVRLGLIELQERDSENNILASNVWRPDRKGGVAGLLMRQQSQQNTYYMTNHLGHVYGVFDQAGERLSQRGYSPYGRVSGDDFALQPFGMSTKRSDFTSGIVYFGYRFYMPNLGRWLNRDPLQEQGGINLYAYVDGDPLGYVDPDGRSPIAAGAAAGGVLAGPPGAVVGGLVGGTAGVALCVLTDLCDWNESGEGEFPAPGKPGEEDGFFPPKKPPKSCDPSGRVKNPIGSGKGWEDHRGDVWVPTGGKADHGGDHWDVQTPKKPRQRRGRHRNVYPGGKVRK